MAASGTANPLVAEFLQPRRQRFLKTPQCELSTLFRFLFWGRKQSSDKTMRIRTRASIREIIWDYNGFLRNDLTLVALLVFFSDASISLSVKRLWIIYMKQNML